MTAKELAEALDQLMIEDGGELSRSQYYLESYALQMLDFIAESKKRHTCSPPPADPQFRGMRWKCECGSHWSFSGTRWLQEQT